MIPTYKSASIIIYSGKQHHLSSSEVMLQDSILDSANVPQALIGTRLKAPQGLLSIIPSQRLHKCSLLERAEPNGCFIVQESFGVIDPIPWNPSLAESTGRQ